VKEHKVKKSLDKAPKKAS